MGVYVAPHVPRPGMQSYQEPRLGAQVLGILQDFEEGLARGLEHLEWHINNQSLIKQPASATLMGGHPIDLDGRVKYGLIAEAQR